MDFFSPFLCLLLLFLEKKKLLFQANCQICPQAYWFFSYCCGHFVFHFIWSGGLIDVAFFYFANKVHTSKYRIGMIWFFNNFLTFLCLTETCNVCRWWKWSLSFMRWEFRLGRNLYFQLNFRMRLAKHFVCTYSLTCI